MSDLAALYVRQSVDNAEGIDRQRERTRTLAEGRGWTVAQVFEDNGASAFKQRGASTGWGRMLAAAKAGAFRYVVAVDLDRLLRGQADLLALIESGARVVTVDGELDLGTADGEFRATMTAALARFEVRRKSERQKRANLHRAASGRPVPGKRRYGFETDGMSPREDEAAVVRRVFEHVHAGGSLYGLAGALNAEGVPTGGRATQWNTRRLRDMCLIVAYGGEVEHLGTVSETEAITPLVPRETARAVRQIIQSPARRVTPGNKATHMLSGIATCGECGSVLTARAGRYNCKATNAGHTSIREDRLDRYVVETVGLQWRVAEPSGAAQSGTLTGLLTESADLSQRRTATTELLFVPGVDVARVKRELSVIDARATEVEAAIIRERGESAASGIAAEARAAWIAAGADDPDGAGFPDFWATLPLDRQRDIVRGMITVTVNRSAGKRGDTADFDRTVITRVNDGKAV